MKVVYATDDIIKTYTENNVLTNPGDFDLHYTTEMRAYKGGVYDSDIFGSIFSKQCNCGKLQDVYGKVCPKCKSMILDSVEAYRRYARIELPVYYCNELKVGQLIQFLKDHFTFKFKVSGSTLNVTDRIPSAFLELLQFNYLGDNVIEATDRVTDVNKCSYEGLLAIIATNFKDLVIEYKSYINSLILVVPIVMRPPTYKIINGRKELGASQITVVYQNILYAINNYYNSAIQSATSDAAINLLNATFRRFIAKITSNLSTLIGPSKQAFSRNMQSTRVPNSGYATIVPAPELKADEVYIPIHLMYEACKEEFVEFLSEHYNCSMDKAEEIYIHRASTDEIKELFNEYIEGNPDDSTSGKYVIINRNPSLHKLSLVLCKVHLTRDYVMKIPIPLCVQLGADFDGDNMSFYAIPKKANEYYMNSMSPRNTIFYEKNHKPLYTPTHEVMMGLIYATRVIVNPGDLMEFDSYNDALNYKRKNRNFKWQTKCIIEGKVTTMGRYKLSDLFNKDIDAYIDNQTFDKNDQPSLNAKNCIALYSNLAGLDDRLDRIQKIQEFCSLIATMSGASTPTLSQLYKATNEEMVAKIKSIEDDPILSDKEKYVVATQLYQKYTKDELDSFDGSVKTMIVESSRAKLSQLTEMTCTRLTTTPSKKYRLGQTRIITGMSPTDYTALAIENRAVQDIKQTSVPNGGDLTRQFSYLAMSYYYSSGLDETNPGIIVRECDAEGRTRVDGTIVEKSNSKDLIKVRSIVTSTYKNPYVITSDMVSKLFKYEDNSRIGLSLITSMTESITQGSLGLKHGGSLFSVEPNGELIATEDCTVALSDYWIIVKTNKVVYQFPKPDDFTLNFASGGNYKKGEVIGLIYKLNSPTYALSSIIALCGARAVNPSKKFARNRVLISDCYAPNDGLIKYTANDRGEISVYVGNTKMEYNSEALYLYPSGHEVKKGDRICSGVVDLSAALSHVRDYLELYYIFRLQVKELTNGISDELIEFLYSLLIKQRNGQIKIDKVINTIRKSDFFFTALAFGHTKEKFLWVPTKGIEFKVDPLTMTMLPNIALNNII